MTAPIEPQTAPTAVRANEAWMNSPKPFRDAWESIGRITAETTARWIKTVPEAAAPQPKNFKIDIFLKRVEFAEKIKLR